MAMKPDDVERLELLDSLRKSAEDVKAGKAIDYDPKRFRDRLIGIFRRSNRSCSDEPSSK
jgi:hypothetical protein